MNFKAVVSAIVVGAFLFTSSPSEASYGRFKNKDVARMRKLTVLLYSERGSGSGVVIAPSKEGKAQVLTNGHVCDALQVYPKIEEYENYTLKQSLYLPVAGYAAFHGGVKAKLTRIVKHAVDPDLCVVEADLRWTGDYARPARRGPVVDNEYMTVGWPGGDMEIARSGHFQGYNLSGHPPRMITPSRLKAFRALQAEAEGLLNEALTILLDQAFGGKKPSPETKARLAEIEKRLKEIEAELRKILAPIVKSDMVFETPTQGGQSGSGVWNTKGELIGLVWGSMSPGFIAVTVPGYEIAKFIKDLD